MSTMPVPVENVPGYYAGLHQRSKPNRNICVCRVTWPCRGARQQIESLRPFVPDFWYDEPHFAAMKAEMERQDAREAARKERKRQPEGDD